MTGLEKAFRHVTVWSTPLFVGAGLYIAGFWGLLTGLVTPVALGSMLTIGIAGTDTDPLRPRRARAQRIGAAIGAIAIIIGVFYVGGWRWGWAYAAGGYLIGTLMTIILGFLLRGWLDPPPLP